MRRGAGSGIDFGRCRTPSPLPQTPTSRPPRRTPSAWTRATTSPSSPTTAACRPGTRASPSGLTLRERVPQGHKVALVDLAAGAPVLRYDVADRLRAASDIAAGSWVHERLLEMPAARALDGLPIATVKPRAAAAARGLHLRGLPQRRRLGRHAQHPRHHARRCSASPASSSFAVAAHQGRAAAAAIRTSTTWSASSTPTAAASRSTRPTR